MKRRKTCSVCLHSNPPRTTRERRRRGPVNGNPPRCVEHGRGPGKAFSHRKYQPGGKKYRETTTGGGGPEREESA